MSTGPGYLDEAARLLRDATAALDRRAGMEEKTTDLAFHRSLMEDRLRLAEACMRMEATRRDAAPPADARLAAVLRFATYASFTNLSEVANSVRLLWVIDQMVRAATGCPEDATVAGLGTSPAYERFRAQVGEWSEGMAP
jgi:hypothetical protein